MALHATLLLLGDIGVSRGVAIVVGDGGAIARHLVLLARLLLLVKDLIVQLCEPLLLLIVHAELLGTSLALTRRHIVDLTVLRDPLVLDILFQAEWLIRDELIFPVGIDAGAIWGAGDLVARLHRRGQTSI